MNAVTSSWQESLHREGFLHSDRFYPSGTVVQGPPRREPVRDLGDAECRAVNGVAPLARSHADILGGAGNGVRNGNGMRAGEVWRRDVDWLAEMEASRKDSRPVDNPPQTEQELLEEMEAKMREYPTLKEGWDGYDAEPLIPGSLDDARKFLAHRPTGVKVPFVGLNAAGEIELYWEEKRVTADIVFEGNGKFYYYAVYRPLSGKDIWRQAEDCDADSRWPAGLVEVVREIGQAVPGQDR